MRISDDLDVVAEITLEDLDSLAIGTGILGSGGGGSPKVGRLRLRALLEDEVNADSIPLVSPVDLPEELTVTSVGQIGSPTVGSEKLPRTEEEMYALKQLERLADTSVEALIPGEIGGANSFAPLIVAAQTGLPVIDADAMGRALPELHMDTFFISGQEVNYAVFTDEKDNTVKYTDIESARRLETLARSVAVDLGGSVAYAYPILNGAFVSEYSIHDTLTLSRELGQQVKDARDATVNPVDRVCEVTGGRKLFTGKVVEVERRHDTGFTTGLLRILEIDGEDTLEIDFQNEFLRATLDGETMTTVPDIIAVLDTEIGQPITSDAVQYGQRVSVVAIPAPDLLQTERALEVVGPRAFGLESDYEPLTR